MFVWRTLSYLLLSFLLLKTHERIRAYEFISRQQKLWGHEDQLTPHLVLGQRMHKITEQLVRRRSLEAKKRSCCVLRPDMRKERGLPEWEPLHLAWAWGETSHNTLWADICTDEVAMWSEADPGGLGWVLDTILSMWIIVHKYLLNQWRHSLFLLIISWICGLPQNLLKTPSKIVWLALRGP